MIVPTGIITFLFTDIEGSTKLAQENNSAYVVSLALHNEILNSVVERNNGFVFKTVGDAFCCAFENSLDAVNAAIEIQMKLNSAVWGDAVIKVRIGIYSGNAEWTGSDYRGSHTVPVVERIMSAAYGGQILISKKTYEDAMGKEQSDISFRDLGERRLKDVVETVRIYQIISPGLRADFPPIKSLDQRQNNLPVQLTSFIGREAEIIQIKNALKDTRLLTLTGSGGVGKTRLAMKVAADVVDEFANGVVLIEIASLVQAELLTQAVMNVFGLKEAPKKDPDEILIDYLRSKELLVILDNCEHLVSVCAKLSVKLLSNCPKLKIIATSREALRSEGELNISVASLKSPGPEDEFSPEKLSQFEAVRLFIERALEVDVNFRATNDNLPAIAEICYRLDGIPLAIELAAARIKILPVEKICSRLKDRFKLLTQGTRTAFPRQQTLKAMIDWSYDLLNEKEKILFERLSVFAGGFTLNSAFEVCGSEDLDEMEILNLISNLSEKSLLSISGQEDEGRFRMLESLRQYGKEKLEINKEEKLEIEKKHFDFFKKLADVSESKLGGKEIKEWKKILDSEIDNFRESINKYMEIDPEESLKLVISLGSYFKIKNYATEGLSYLNRILETGTSFEKKTEAYALLWKANLLDSKSERDDIDAILERSIGLFTEISYEKGICEALRLRAYNALSLAEFEKAKLLAGQSEAISRKIGQKISLALILDVQGGIAYMEADYVSAKKKFEESLSIFLELHAVKNLSQMYSNLGIVEFQNSNYDKALEYYEKALAIDYELDNKTALYIKLINISIVHNRLGNYAKAKELQEKSLDIGLESGNKLIIAQSLNVLGATELMLENYELSKSYFLKTLKIFFELHNKFQLPETLLLLTQTLNKLNQPAKASQLLSVSKTLYNILGIKMNKIDTANFETGLAYVKSVLTQEEFDEEWKKGELINFENVDEMINELGIEN